MSIKKTFFVSHSAAQTIRIGRIFGRSLKAGDVVALQGKLGAGKTTLVKGIAKGLGLSSAKLVSSPTYALIHEYQGQKKIYHLDWYRLNHVKGADAEFARECFDSDGVTLVEWPERGAKLLPKGTVRVRISHQGPSTRRLQVVFPEDP